MANMHACLKHNACSHRFHFMSNDILIITGKSNNSGDVGPVLQLKSTSRKASSLSRQLYHTKPLTVNAFFFNLTAFDERTMSDCIQVHIHLHCCWLSAIFVDVVGTTN